MRQVARHVSVGVGGRRSVQTWARRVTHLSLAVYPVFDVNMDASSVRPSSCETMRPIVGDQQRDAERGFAQIRPQSGSVRQSRNGLNSVQETAVKDCARGASHLR